MTDVPVHLATPDAPDLSDEDYWARLCAEDAASVGREPVETTISGDFWQMRPVLRHIQQFAYARRAEPWVVLGSVLAGVLAATPPVVQLPKTIGSYGSLNLIVGLVGPSSSGKDIGRRVAQEAVDLSLGTPFSRFPVGSGEGLAHMFMRQLKDGTYEQYNTAALVTIGEIDTFSALVKRNSSTIAAQLRQAAMGEELGMFYVDPSKRMIVREHSYRLCVLAGIQPRRSAILLDDADGGTPQRFLWLPTINPNAPSARPPEPPPMLWEPPDWGGVKAEVIGGWQHKVMKIPDIAAEMIDRARLQNWRGEEGGLNGHGLLTRCKVAAGLGVLEGRTDPDEDDWVLAGHIMTVSDSTRAYCQAELAEMGREHNAQQGAAEAERTIVVRDRVSRNDLTRATKAIKRRLALAGSDGVTGSELRKSLRADIRGHFQEAVQLLTVTGDMIEKPTKGGGVDGTRYFRADHG